MTGPPDTALDVRLVPAALTSWAVTASGIVWGAWASVWVIVAAVGALVAATWWRRRREPASLASWPAVVAVATVGVTFGIAVGLRVHDAARNPVVSYVGTTVTATVSVAESPRTIRGGRLMFRADLDALNGTQASGRVIVYTATSGYGTLVPGQPVTFRARVARPARRDLSVAVLSASGELALGEAPAWQRTAARVRAEFAAAARDVLPPDQAAMLPALVLGDTSALGQATVADFREAGLTHLTAVSGANVTIVCGAVLLTAAVVGPRAAAIAAALALAAFVAVVQPSASVLRAAVMGAIALFAIVSHRRRQAVPALSASVLILMVVAPELAVDIGFALSVVATAALVVIAPVWSERLVARGWPKPLAAAVAIALAAQVVTAPIVAGISGTVSLVAVAANLVVAVVIPPITVLGTAAAAISVGLPAVARFLIRFTGPELWWLLHVARWAAAVPGASVAAPSGWVGVGCVAATACCVVVSWRWRAGRIGLAAAMLVLLAWSAGRSAGAVGAT